MKRKKYYYLDPVIIRIPGIKTLFEKSVGKRDARQNQVCSNGEVHTTPFIDAKVNSYSAHIEKLLLKTTNELAPMIQEANSLLVEYSLMESHKGGELPEGCGEEAQRQKAAVAANYALEERRKEEILKRLAKIRTESDIVDEMLVHYQERAERLLNSRICRYWSGVLCQNPDKDKLENFPKIKYQDSPGRKAYVTNKEKLHTMIDRVLNL